MNQKPSEAGWFYHAPAKKAEHVETVGAPPASQIPGLGDISVLPKDKPKEMMFRDSDSKYIRMAKMGGRKDLLVIRPNSGTKKEPQGYPRNDWFYLEDNAQQDRANFENTGSTKEPWRFMLPDYMCHQGVEQITLPDEMHAAHTGNNTVPMRPAPFATEQSSPRKVQPKKSKDGCVTVKIATRKKAPGPGTEDDRSQINYPPPYPPKQGEPTVMSKLLAYSYEKEWHEQHKEWEDKKVASSRKKIQPATNKGSDPGGRVDANTRPPAGPSKSGRQEYADANNNKPQQQEETKEPFKLSKFKNVPSRLDTRRSTDSSRGK